VDRHPELAIRRTTPPGTSAGRLVLVHGFTQSSRCWSPVDDDLAADHEVVRVDAPGHGGSTDVRADLWASGQAIADAGGPGTYVGYSMGARMALHAALLAPEQVRRLVLVSATAGIDDDEARAARRASDAKLAAHLLDVGVEQFVDEWLAQPLFATLPAERAHRTERLVNDPEGLASSLRLAGTGTQDPLWDRLGALTMPVLVVAGELDATYCRHAERLVASIGAHSELAVVGGAGHTVHLEQPEAFLSLVRDWLARTPG
jgi:2-succinyl-6-hydroxy-2,4-cyclohexadiene-1-carboxylate synthase